MTDPCSLTPPINAGRTALEAHLKMLRGMNGDDPLVQLAIQDTEIRLAALPSA
jgi:hypothetical protein